MWYKNNFYSPQIWYGALYEVRTEMIAAYSKTSKAE